LYKFIVLAKDVLKPQGDEMKKLLIILACVLAVLASCDSKSAIQKQMEETAKKNKEMKAKIEAEKNKKKKFVDTEIKEELPAIVEAAKKGDLSAVKAELQKGTVVDTKDGRKRSALYHAVSKGKCDVVKHLISEDANVNTKRDDGDTPLMAAARKADQKMVGILLEANADVNATDNFGRTPLMMAAQGGSKDIVDALLAKKVDIDARDKYELSALIFAMKYKHMDLAKYILGKGAKVWKPAPVKYSKKPTTLKIEGKAQPGMEEIIAELDKKEVKLRQKTELFYAIEKGDLDLVKILIKKGAPVIVTDVDQSRENIIYVMGAKEEERDMLFERATERTSYDRDQKNLLHYAAEGGYKEIMKYLIKKGARLEETDGENVRGPLFYVVGQPIDTKDSGKAKRLLETADFIVEEGKKLWKKQVRFSKKELDKIREENKSKPWYDQNPFDVEFKIVESPKVDLEEYDYEGWTVLPLAAKNGQKELVKLLVEKGANVNHKERKFGRTALMYAEIGKFTEIATFLKANCAKEGIQFDYEELMKKGWKCVDGKEVYEKPEKKK